MKQLSDKEASRYGICTIHHEMDNGEKRFRLVSEHGSSYILTQGNATAGWQNSHIHYHKKEYYVIEQGWAFLARLIDGKLTIDKYGESDSFFIPAGVAHNIFLSENALLHTVKFGTAEEDWNSSQELDALLSDVAVQDFL